jgi:hypothetical protein
MLALCKFSRKFVDLKRESTFVKIVAFDCRYHYILTQVTWKWVRVHSSERRRRRRRRRTRRSLLRGGGGRGGRGREAYLES